MNRLLHAAAALFCAVGLSASAQMTTVTASSINMAGVPVASGTISFTPVNAIGAPVGLSVGGSFYDAQAFTGTITNGAIVSGFQVPDLSLAVPSVANTALQYQVTIYNTATKKSYTLQAVQGVQGGTWAFDHYAPTQSAVVSSTGLMTGSAVPTTCHGASLFYTQTSPASTYECVGGSYVMQAAGSGSVSLSIGTVTTGAAGSQAAASITNGLLNLTVPTGATGSTGTAGSTPTFTIGTITTGSAGSNAAVSITGTAPAYVLNFTIPQGAAGSSGSGSSIALKTNGTTNGSQTVLNLVQGSGITISSDGSGNVTVAAAVSSVNGKTGALTLSASDVGADASGAAAAAQAASIPLTQKGAASGVASLDTTAQVPLAQLGNAAVLKRMYSVDWAGDSYMACWGATSVNTCQFGKFMNDTPTAVQKVPYAVGGTLMETIAKSVFQNYTPNATYPQALVVNGGNNNYTYDTCTKTAGTTGTNCLVNYQQILDATISMADVPTQNRILASNATKSGTWTTDNTVPMSTFNGATAGTAVASSTAGNTLTFSIPASNNGYVGIIQPTVNTATGTYTLTIGGVAQTSTCPSGTTTFSSGPCNGQILLNGITSAPQRQMFHNPAWAGQAVQAVVTVQSGTVPIIAMDYSPSTLPANAGIVFVENSGAAYDGSGVYSVASAAVVAAHQAAGLQACPVDIRSALLAVNGSGVSQTDTTSYKGSLAANHPGDEGQDAEYRALLAAEAACGYKISSPGAGAQLAFNAGAFLTPISAPSCT